MLIVVVDISRHWLDAQSDLPFPRFLTHLQAFLNSYIADSSQNALAVIAAAPGRSTLLYSHHQEHLGHDPDPNSYSPFSIVGSAIVDKLTKLFDDVTSLTEPCALVGALTKALCHINRVSSNPQNAAEGSVVAEPRILILSVSPDISTSYIPIMNAIFSAQKLKVTIDVCQIYGPNTVFLQQAAHLTGGSYVQLQKAEALLQYLIMAFLPPPSIRNTLAVPTQDKVDFRAACFCHKNIIDVGFVCSVCLSIFCQPVPVCSTCRTKFPIKTLQRLNASRPPASGPSPSQTPSRPSVAPTTPTNLNSLPNSNSILRPSNHAATPSNGRET